MTKKRTEIVQRLLKEVEPRHPYPDAPLEGVGLVAQGAYLVLLRHMTQNQAEASVRNLLVAYEDWNEVRVSQAQEIAAHFKTSSRKKGPTLLNELRPGARALKDYLQDVYQKTHHLDLEELREDEASAGKTAASLTELGLTGAAYLLWVAQDGRIPVHLPLVRLLDRLGLIQRTTSLKKARESIESIVPEGEELAFTIAVHEVLDRWDDDETPIYTEVPVLQSIPFGKKALKEREAQLARQEAQRQREEARAVREAERERKRQEAAAKKQARELERRRKAAAKKAAAERRKSEAAKKKAATAKKAKEAAARKKKATSKKKASAKKKAAGKRASSKKKPAARKKPAAKKKAAAKKGTGRKKAPAKQKAAKKKTARKGTPSGKKSTARKKSGARKKTTRKPSRRR